MSESSVIFKANNVIALVLNFALIAFLAVIATPYMAIATTAYSALAWGMLFRFHRKQHAVLMNIGICIDIALVLTLELQRDAIAKAMEFSMTGLQQSHVLASTMALVLYFPILYLGWGRYTGKLTGPGSREWHMRLGKAAFILRTIGFVLMFSMLERLKK